MAYRASLIERVLFVRFLSQPDLGDLATLTREVSNARAAAASNLHLCFALATHGAVVPDPDLRAALNRFVSQSLSLAEALDLVISGDGAEAMFVRTIWRGLVSASRWHGKVFVHSDMPPALARIGEVLRIDPAQLAARIDETTATKTPSTAPGATGRKGEQGRP